eukprot:GHVP01032994.1.p1 GENE.GHVP01032994.1~~GHVP01032994.1.p1  ORF type:complete len:209 (-),score=20.95 GHVP01032994.1:86-712(-)
MTNLTEPQNSSHDNSSIRNTFGEGRESNSPTTTGTAVMADVTTLTTPLITPDGTTTTTTSNSTITTPISNLLSSFHPESSGIILGLEPPAPPARRKGYTTPEIKAYRKWCSDLKRHGKIERCPNPAYVADANLVRKKDGSYRVTHNFGPLRSITSTLNSSMPKKKPKFFRRDVKYTNVFYRMETSQETIDEVKKLSKLEYRQAPHQQQ